MDFFQVTDEGKPKSKHQQQQSDVSASPRGNQKSSMKNTYEYHINESLKSSSISSMSSSSTPNSSHCSPSSSASLFSPNATANTALSTVNNHKRKNDSSDEESCPAHESTTTTGITTQGVMSFHGKMKATSSGVVTATGDDTDSDLVVDDDSCSQYNSKYSSKSSSSACNKSTSSSASSSGNAKASKLEQSTSSHMDDSAGSTSMTKAKIETMKGNDRDLNKIECYLETDDLWKKFHELGTEMIITKSGR